MFKMMDPNEDAESHEDRPPSPYWVLQHLSEEAFRVAGEALHSVYSVNLDFQPMQTAHRRSHSEVGSTGQLRTNSFHKLKSRMQKAWQRGGNTRDQSFMSSFNPEVLANQKRQWYQLHSKALDHKKYKEPTSLFEHFVIAGLHPDANLEAVEDAFARRKRWELEMAKPEMMEFKGLQHRAPSFPSMEPQILFRYPLGKRLPLRLKDLAAFCFPAGVKTCLLERTPSLNELNELIYGQEHLGRDDLSFIFSLKVADHDTLYGVCLHVTEIAQRPPGILGNSSPLSHPSRRPCRFLVSAPRCYCVLTRVPFFELHYEMLNSIIAQERLSRITQFVNELSITSYMPLPVSGHHDQVNANDDCRDKLYGIDLMASAIPVDSAVALSAAAAGIITDDEMQALSPKILEPHSPESVTCSEASCFSQAREVDKDCKRSLQCYDDCASESSENHSDTFERSYGNCENDQASPDIGRFSCSKSSTLERLGSFDFSPVKSRASEDEDEDLFSSHEKDFGDALIMEWARETKNDLLSIVCGYHAMTVPERGSVIVFCPLEHLQAIEYARPLVSDLGIYGNYPDSFETAKVNANLAAAEEAFALSIWTTATICRVLSLECILALITGVLLEKQVVVVCPNLGVLSAMVLSLVPMIRPFQWQSLFLPILPGTMLDFLDAPVPFIVGLQNKPADLKIKTSNLVHVNIQKDRVKTCHLPTLPRYKELVRELGPIHARLSFEGPIARKHPVYRCNEVQAEAATQFLNVMRRYMESLCSDLRSHTITSVESNNDRVSLLLKDSFIDSFPSRDRSFIRVLVDTQLFAVLSDSRLSSFENGRL